MKKFVGILALCALAFAACQKENGNPAREPVSGPLTFIVSTPETRTELDGRSVLWVENDEIRVFGFTDNTTQASAVFAFTRTNDDGTALFTIKDGETLGEYANYYAAYPAMAGVSVSADSKGNMTMTYPRMNVFPYSVRNQRPAAGGFDSKLTIMTAKYDGERLAFRHGIGYVKIAVPYDNVTSIDINFTNNCLGDTPTYNLETGAISSLGNSSKNITANVSSGTFVKGQAYYLAAIPRSGNSIGLTTVSYTIEESDPVTVSTNHFEGKSVEFGKIFDLGSPAKPTSPKITFTTPAKLAYDATSGSFPYAVANPVSGQSVTATLESGVDWISNIVVGADAVTFTCSKNNATDAQERSAVITLHYTGAADVPVTVTQGVSGSVEEDYVWDFSSSDWVAELQSKGNSNSDITNWTSSVNGLTWTSTAKSKWNTRTIGGVTYTYIQAGGKGSTSDRVFTFTVQNAGKLYVTTTGTSSTADNSRMCTVKVGDSDAVSKSGGSAQDDLTVNEFDIPAGNVFVYPTGNALRFFKIEFHKN